MKAAAKDNENNLAIQKYRRRQAGFTLLFIE